MMIFTQSRHKKTPLTILFKDESIPLRGTTLLHLCLTAEALWSTNILPRFDGRTRRDLCVMQSAAPLQGHLQPSLPYPFPPYRALFAVSLGLLSSSLRLRGVFSSAWVAPSIAYGPPPCQVFTLNKRRRADKGIFCPPFPNGYIAPGNLRCWRTFFLCRSRAFFLSAWERIRLSVRTAARVPMDWKICTRITSTRTDTYMMIYIRRW